MISRRSVLVAAVAMGVALVLAGAARAAEDGGKRPNILFFLIDDQRNDTLGCAGHPIIKTPVVDGLAATGVRFSNMFVTTSICAASRASIFTGLHERTHRFTFGTPAIRAEYITASYPALLKKAGYQTGFIGKFGVKVAGSATGEMFDFFKPHGRGPYLKKQPDGSLRHETEIAGDKALEFLAGVPEGKPFCLSVSFNAVHAEDGDKRPGIGHYPWPKAVDGMYEDVTVPAPRLSQPEVFAAHPQFFKESMNRDRFFWRWDTPEKYQTNIRAYFRMISGVDRVIGRVVAELKKRGLAENTVVIYTGDNGYYQGQRGFAGKWSHYEESLRVPLIIHDPRLEKAKRGAVTGPVALNIDLPATMLDLAGLPVPKHYGGKSLLPILTDKTPAGWRTDFFCEHLMNNARIHKWEGVRGSQYVYARYFQQQPAYEFLHDLKADPDQLKNFVADPKYAAVLTKMRARCDELRDAYGGPYKPHAKPAKPARKPSRQQAAPGARPVLLVPVPEKPGWRDMAFLAAVPAMTVATDGKPAVIALNEAGEITREVADYLRRYKPTATYRLTSPSGKVDPSGQLYRMLPATSADAAARALAEAFWSACETAVVCGEDDYTGALVASALAAKLRSPLLTTGKAGPSAATFKAVKTLGVKRALLIGSAAASRKEIEAKGLSVVELADARAVLAWMGKQGLKADYIAAVNPTDRERTVIKKLSLAGALLAAGRSGMVVPLAYETQWKTGFLGEDVPQEAPKDAPKGKGKAAAKGKTKPPTTRKGAIELDGRRYAFVAVHEANGRPGPLKIDLDGNGEFEGAGEGPLSMCDTVTLGAKCYVVTVGERSGIGKADVRLTWPAAEEIAGDLRRHYDAAGGSPEHLCIVGFPDAIPQGLLPGGGKFGDLTTDLPYTNVDEDLFAEIGVARLIAEDASLATVYASRALTYEQLADESWRRNVGEARWENTYTKVFENVGFRPSIRHDKKDLKWLIEPAEGVKGKLAREFDADSPLTSVAAIAHMAHSWWKDLGQTYSWDSTVLLAPTLVESGGCLTATLDRDPNCRSIIARLMRNGATGFVGNSRPGIAHQEQLRAEFWNGVLAGETIGQAHRRSLNSMAVTVLETGQLERGSDRYQLYIRTLFGDPAFAMAVPSQPRSAPARVDVKGQTVSVHAPETWWPVKMRVPEDWKKWAEKDLYVCRGAGAYPFRTWCREEYDRETTYVNAEFRTAKRVKAIRQVQQPDKPLGWREKYVVDEHADGTRTYRWRVQLIDFDQIEGKILSKVDRLDYRIEWDAPRR